MAAKTELQELRIDTLHGARRHSHSPTLSHVNEGRGMAKVSSRSTDYVYVNAGYVGSLSNVTENRLPTPPTTVIREQYWACSKWPFGQRALLVAVAVLLGAVIGLTIAMVLTGRKPTEVIGGGIFRIRAVPD